MVPSRVDPHDDILLADAVAVDVVTHAVWRVGDVTLREAAAAVRLSILPLRRDKVPLPEACRATTAANVDTVWHSASHIIQGVGAVIFTPIETQSPPSTNSLPD